MNFYHFQFTYFTIITSINEIMYVVRIFLVSNKCLKQNTYGTQRPRLDLNKNNNWTNNKQLHMSFWFSNIQQTKNVCVIKWQALKVSLQLWILSKILTQNMYVKKETKKKSWEPFRSYLLNSTAKPAKFEWKWAGLAVLFSR